MAVVAWMALLQSMPAVLYPCVIRCALDMTMLHYEQICTKARLATERVGRAFDEHVATSRTSRNPVSHATVQVAHAMPHACLAMLSAVSRHLSISMPVAFLMSGVLRHQRSTYLRMPR